jgi:cytoskeletal protein CcmA (bactofilin family)
MRGWRRSLPIDPDPTPQPCQAAAARTPEPGGGVTLVLGQGIEIRGSLSSTEDLRIDGTVDGEVSAPGHRVIVGVGGRVAADVRAKSVVVRGFVAGDIVAEDRVEVLPTGSVLGDIQASRVILTEGATFHGAINRGAKPPGARSTVAAAPVPPTTPPTKPPVAPPAPAAGRRIGPPLWTWDEAS